MKRILLAGATLLALTAAQPTLAADAPTYKGPAPYAAAALFNWSGIYIGIQGGGAWANYPFDYTPSGFPGVDVGGRATGWLLGGTLGGNWQAPGSNIVLGIEGDYAWANIRGGGPCPNPAFSCDVDLNTFGTIRGRVGVAMNTWLLYATAGAAFGNLSASTTLPGGVVPPSGGPTNGQRIWRSGWTGGLGTEVALGGNWSAKLEWLYFDLGTGNYNIDNGLVIVSGLRGSVVRGGLNWRF